MDMDPNIALARLRTLVGELEYLLPGPDILATTHVEDAAVEVIKAFEELDQGLRKGGFGLEVGARTVDEHTTAVTIAGVDVYVRNTPGDVSVCVGVDDLPPGKSARVEAFDGVSWEHELP